VLLWVLFLVQLDHPVPRLHQLPALVAKDLFVSEAIVSVSPGVNVIINILGDFRQFSVKMGVFLEIKVMIQCLQKSSVN
jgi:hypothetical protein